MFKAKLKQSYSFKMLFCIFLVLIIILLAFVAYLFNVERNQGIKVMENYNESVIASVNSDFDILDTSARSAYISKNIHGITALMYSENINDDTDDYINTLTKYLSILPDYDSALIYNNKLQSFRYFNLTSATSTEISDNILNNASNTSAFKPYISKIPNISTSRYVISYYNYDYKNNNTMDGAFVLNLSLNWINNIIDQQTIGVNVMLCDADGKVMYDAKNNRDYGLNLSKQYLEALKYENSSFSTKVNNEANYVTISPLGNSGYYCVVEQPYSSTYSGYMNGLIVNFIFLIFFIILLSIVVAVVLSNYLSMPIRRLRKKIAKDDLTADNDLFEYISDLIDTNDSAQLDEMQVLLDDMRQQNVLKQILVGSKTVDKDDYDELEAMFADCDITGVRLDFADIVDMSGARRVVTNLFEDIDTYKFVQLNNNSLLVLLRTGVDEVASSQILLENLRDTFANELNMLPSVFVSEKYSFNDLNMLYNELNIIASYELLYGRGCIINSEIIAANNNEQNPVYPKGKEDELLSAIDTHNVDNCIVAFDSFLGDIISFSLNDFKASLMRLAFALEGKYESGSSKTHRSEVSSLIKQVSSANTMNDVYNCFTRLFEIASLSDDAPSTQNYQHSYVEQAIKIIKAHYKDPLLNLESVSDEIKLSTNYLGRLFKAETGLSLNAYLTKFRLEKSIALLDEHDISIKEVITETGFTNESNFYRQFKKQYGITPSAYRAK